MKETRSYVKDHPIRIGLFVILGVVALGSLSALSLGYAAPAPANAQVTVSPVTVTAHVTQTSTTVTTAATNVVNTVVNTVNTVVNTVTNTNHTNTTNNGNGNGNGNQNSGETSVGGGEGHEVEGVTVVAGGTNDGTVYSGPPAVTTNGQTTVAPVVVTAHADETSTTPGTPSVTNPDGTTEVEQVVVVANPPTGSDPETDPCCTLPTDPTEVTPLIVTAQPPVIADIDTVPCCTLPPVTPTTPVTPVVVVPPVIVPQFDMCINIDGIQTQVPTGMQRNNDAHCVTIYVPPACTLVANPTSIQLGHTSTLTWTTDNATTVSINNGVGVVNADGSVVVAPLFTTTYTLTATGAGGTVTCPTTVTVTITPPPPPAPTCTLVASPTAIQQGGSSILSWTTQNAASFSVDQGIGLLTPLAGGSRVVSPAVTTTYTGTVVGTNGDVVHCTATVTVTSTPPPPGPVCTLVANPTVIQNGGSSILTWTTQNANSFSINQGIGAVSPVVGGSRTVSPTVTTTYTGTAIGGNGQTVHCTATVTVTNVPPPPAPVCTLVANPTTIQNGGTSVLTWTTENATSFSINQGIGAVNNVSGGSRNVTPAVTTTYTGTATGAGGTVNCTATVTVVSHPPAPVCTLVANPVAVQQGGSSTLTWTTQNATSFSIDQGIGGQIAVSGGSHTVTPANTTTYTGTATSANGTTVTCAATVTVTNNPPPPAPICTLVANPSSVQQGGSSTLTWTTQNATSFSIDQGIGAVATVSGGSQTVTPANTTTYTGTATGPGGTVTCATTVTVTNTPPAPQCVLTVSPTSVVKGGTASLSWSGTNIVSVILDQGIGAKGATGSVNVSPETTTTYTGTFTATNGQTLSCSATLQITNDDGVCTENCGGGGGGGGRKNPRVILSSLKTPDDQPLAFVYLSEVPYTGLDLGPIGTAFYWAMIALWSFAAAYLIFFNALPFAYRRIGSFGANVKDVLNQPAPAHAQHVMPSVPAHAPAPAHAQAAGHGHAPAHAAHHAPVAPKAPVVEHDGFRAYASGETLTIDDIVKGLAREAAANPTASAHSLTPAFVAAVEEPAHAPMVEQIQEAIPTPRPMAHAQHAAPFNEDVRIFIEALLRGDRETVFGTIRGITRNGGDSEAFLTHAVCALDDAYRSKVDGSTCHPDILAATADCHPSFLERVVTSLTTAVDGSYSTGITGVKLALTRALAVVNG
jgi:hypothetical protein